MMGFFTGYVVGGYGRGAASSVGIGSGGKRFGAAGVLKLAGAGARIAGVVHRVLDRLGHSQQLIHPTKKCALGGGPNRENTFRIT
jgi:hypothetical protein